MKDDSFYSLKKDRQETKFEQKSQCQKLIVNKSWWQFFLEIKLYKNDYKIFEVAKDTHHFDDRSL